MDDHHDSILEKFFLAYNFYSAASASCLHSRKDQFYKKMTPYAWVIFWKCFRQPFRCWISCLSTFHRKSNHSYLWLGAMHVRLLIDIEYQFFIEIGQVVSSFVVFAWSLSYSFRWDVKFFNGNIPVEKKPLKSNRLNNLNFETSKYSFILFYSYKYTIGFQINKMKEYKK